MHKVFELTVVTHRYGVCVPFYPTISSTLCDSVYEPGVDYVYVPKNRSRGSYPRLIRDIARYGFFLLEPLARCFEPARQLLCHFYLPPCGNVTHFKPPSAVCSEQCWAVSQMCPEEWAAIEDRFRENDVIIATEGLQLINCDFPGKHLSPLPHCCSDLGLNTCESGVTWIFMSPFSYSLDPGFCLIFCSIHTRSTPQATVHVSVDADTSRALSQEKPRP